jgi:hypothetical protein
LRDESAPDLELRIGLDRSGSSPVLELELQGSGDGGHRRFESLVLEDDPAHLLKSFFDRAQTHVAEEGLHPFLDFGAYLSALLLPEALSETLEAQLDPVRTLQILTDEPWIPWELVRLERGAGGRRPGPFLCEAFDLSRWLGRRPQPLTVSLENLALVAPCDSELDIDDELRFLEGLAGAGRRVERIRAMPTSVRQACASGQYDAFHFSGHGRAVQLADRAEIRLEDRTAFSPVNLYGDARRLGERRPLVFLNGCHTGRAGFSLTGLGGWAEHLLAIGCAAFVGTHWAVQTESAGAFAERFYSGLLDGLPMAQAFRLARAAIRSETDPSWLAYTLYAHPDTRVGAGEAETFYVSRFATDEGAPVLELPEPKALGPSPSAILQAEYQVVPFHGRAQELAELYEWCTDGEPAAVRLYTGVGGMGKTRLALEIARHLRDERWEAGFLPVEDMARESADGPWGRVTSTGRPALVVMDYAESRRPLLVSLLRHMKVHSGPPVRLLLLARGEVGWWTRLKAEGRGVGDFLQGPSTRVHALSPLAPSLPEKERTYRIAARAFTESLGREVPGDPPENLGAPFYDRVLLIHMSALVKMEGRPVSDEERILDYLLLRERRFWERRVADWNLPPTVVPGLGRALTVITMAGGAEGETAAVTHLRKLRFFQDREHDVLVSVVRLLRECYPGRLWIEPLQPDTLGTHLFRRELEDGADELLEIAGDLQDGPDTDVIEGIS